MSKSQWLGLKIVQYGPDEQTPIGELPNEFIAVGICTDCGTIFAKAFEFLHREGCTMRKGGDFPL